MYKFNEHMCDLLREGKATILHTKKAEDLDLLIEVLKYTFPDPSNSDAKGTRKYYTADSTIRWFGGDPDKHIKGVLYPLEAFLDKMPSLLIF